MRINTRLAFALWIGAAQFLSSTTPLQAGELSFRRVLPGVVQAPPVEGARVETSAWLVNLGPSSASFEFGLIPLSTAAAPPVQVKVLAPGETLRLNNPLRELFGLTEAEGALVVRGEQPFDLRGVNTRYAAPTAVPTVESFSSVELLGPDSAGHSLWLANRPDPDPEFRTDVTAVLAAPNTTLTVSLYDASGLLRGIQIVTSPQPAIWRASAASLLTDPEIPIGRVKFAVTAGEATGFLSVTGIAPGTGFIAQPERISPATADESSLLLNGVSASTKLRLFNPNDSELIVTIEALGFPGAPAILRQTAVPAASVIEIADVLTSDAFVLPEGAVGALRFRAPLPFLAAGRGLTQAVPYRTGFATSKQPVALLGLNENVNLPEVRSRISLLAGDSGAKGLLRLRDARGLSITTAPLLLEPNQWQGKSITEWFPNTEIPADARVDIELENGSANGYAEVVDRLALSRVVISPASVPVEPPPPPTAKRLAFSVQPSSFTSGATFSVTVRALLPDNTVDTRYTGVIELRADGPSGFTAPLTKTAQAGVASFTGLTLAVTGRYTLTALASGLESATSNPFEVNPVPPPAATILRVGTFSGQNGYVAQGTLQIERTSNGGELLRLNPNFRVSAGAGSITVWLARSSGPLNASDSIRVGTITRTFSGEFTFPIPASGSSGFTHVIVYCDPFRINFGAAQLRNP